MAVLQFAFEPAYEYNAHDPENHEPNQVVYTGTHDNDTVCGWWWDLPDHRRELARAACRRAGVGADVDARAVVGVIELALRGPRAGCR